MANMREIRNRMKSIQDTMKITKAMYVVSSSKLKKAQKQYDRTKPYYKALSNTMADIMEHIEPEVTHKYINDKPPVDESKVNRLFIVVTQCLCGLEVQRNPFFDRFLAPDGRHQWHRGRFRLSDLS